MSAVTQELLSSTKVQCYLEKMVETGKSEKESVAIIPVGSDATPKHVNGGSRKEK